MTELASDAWEVSSASESVSSPLPPPIVTSASINAAFDVDDSASEGEIGHAAGVTEQRSAETEARRTEPGVSQTLSSPSPSSSSSSSSLSSSPRRRPRSQTDLGTAGCSLTPGALGHLQLGAPPTTPLPSSSSPALLIVDAGVVADGAADDVDRLASWYRNQSLRRSAPASGMGHYVPLGDVAESGESSGGSFETDDDSVREDDRQEGRHVSRDSVMSSGAALSLASSRLKKGWRAVKRSSQKSTASAVKTTASASRRVSSLSSAYWKAASASAAGSTRGSGLPMTPEERTVWEERQSELCSEWANSILPSWKKKRSSARVRGLAFRGIPPGVRGRVWLVALGNPLNITPELFHVLRDRAYDGRIEFLRSRDALDKADGDVGGHGGRAEPMLKEERSAHKAIMLDLPRTFPELAFFHADGSQYEDALREVLEAFMYLRPDIGYSQGMSFLAAVLLLYLDETVDAFACFANMLLHKSCFLHFFSMKMPEVRIYLSMHDRFMREEMPALHGHLLKHGVDPDLYMINWVMSLYCGALPLDLVSRIWDIYMLDGDVAVFRAALGILKVLMPRLLTMGFEDIAYLLSHLPQDMEADVLLHAIRGVRTVTRQRFKECFRSCSQKHTAAAAAAATAVAAAAAAETKVTAAPAAAGAPAALPAPDSPVVDVVTMDAVALDMVSESPQRTTSGGHDQLEYFEQY